MADAGAYQEGDAGANETGERGGEGEGGGATFGGILLGEPEGVDGEIGAAEAEKEKTEEEPGERVLREVENFAESERNKDGHKREEKGESAATAEAFGEGGHGEAAENGGEGDEHGGPGSELHGSGANAAAGFGEGGNGGGNVNGAGPEAADRDDHEQRIQNGAAAERGSEERGERTPPGPGVDDFFFLQPALGFSDAATEPGEQERGQASE